MKTLILSFLLLGAACSGQQYSARQKPLPPAPPPAPTVPTPTIAPMNEDATRAWLDREIERAPRVEPPEPIVQVVERVVERPVYVSSAYDYGYSYRYPHYDPYYRSRYYRHSTFPINTAIGAGVGAIIGHQSGRRGRGAWIGGSLGFLFDVAGW